MKISQKQFIKNYLTDRFGLWCNGWLLSNRGKIMSHTGRISDIRREGFKIINEKRRDKKKKQYHTWYKMI